MENKHSYDDLKVCDLGNGKILVVMKKETYSLICDILELAAKQYNENRAAAELP